MAYRDVVNSLEHLILSKPDDWPLDDIPIWSLAHYRSRVRSTDGSARLSAVRKAVHVLTGVDNPSAVLSEGVEAFSLFRYSGVLATPYQSSNVHDVTWNVMLDILVKGTADSNAWQRGEDEYREGFDSGVYSPGRGVLIDYLIGRFMRNPILTPVQRRNVNAKENDYVGWGLAGETPFERDDSAATYIRGVQVEDTTDLNYWTLLWTAGLANSFVGWWPTTLTFTVTERVSPGVESYG